MRRKGANPNRGSRLANFCNISSSTDHLIVEILQMRSASRYFTILAKTETTLSLEDKCVTTTICRHCSYRTFTALSASSPSVLLFHQGETAVAEWYLKILHIQVSRKD